MSGKTCAFIGHLPARSSFAFSRDDRLCTGIRELISERFQAYIDAGVTEFSVDTNLWLISLLRELRSERRGIALGVVCPYSKQGMDWPSRQRARYNEVLFSGNAVEFLNKDYTRGAARQSIRYLIDYADYVFAVYDDAKGRANAAYAVKYALSRARPLTVVHPATLEMKINPGSGHGHTH